MVSIPTLLCVNWNKKRIEISFDEDTTVRDVIEELERRTEVPADRQRFSPKLFHPKNLNTYLFDIKSICQSKKNVVTVLMIGSVPKPDPVPVPVPVVAPTPVVPTPVAPVQRSAEYKSYFKKLEAISASVASIEEDINSKTSLPKPTADKVTRTRLTWTEHLTRAQLQLDALSLPPEGQVSAEERLDLRKQRKAVVLSAEKLILRAERY